MSLRDATQKMSKSAESDMSRINLTDDPDTISKKIKKAQTDPEPLPETVDGLEGRAGAANLISIYAALSDRTKADVLADFGGRPFSEFKPVLADLCVEKLAPLTARMRELMADPAEIDQILKAGSDKANAIAAPVIEETMKVMGFWKR